ncbi:hypothetical protein Tco_0926391 [Tanacetum coccineum]|uniref:CCHC-type domain-containing protein n=1 Tax=Tanacetum coccineum TaxID=301880 RepID=A0ABQ5DCA2_9ASTR
MLRRNKDMQKNLALIAKYFKKLYKPTNNNLRTSSNTRNKNVDTTPRETVGGPLVQQTGKQCFNCKEFVNMLRECRKPKRGKRTPHMEEEIEDQEWKHITVYMQRIQEVPNADTWHRCRSLEQVQYDTDDNVFANDIQHFDQSKSISNTSAVETGDSNVTPDLLDMRDNDIQDNQNDVKCDDERVALANLIAN